MALRQAQNQRVKLDLSSMRIFNQIKLFQMHNHKKFMGRLRIINKSKLLVIHNNQQNIPKDKIRINKDLEKEKKKQ